MTDQPLKLLQPQLSFEERVEIVANELDLAIRWQSPCVLFVVYSSEYVRANVETMLENYLIDLEQEITHIIAESDPPKSLFQLMEAYQPYVNRVFFVDDLSWSHSDCGSVFASFDARREFFIEHRIRIVFWLTQNEIVNLSRWAPSFWAIRNYTVEFVEAPKPEQVLVEELETAWQGTGGYADQYEDTDNKISLRESLLTAIPKQDETTSIRANMYLTLGILNWRKGDFEKADEQLQLALKSAIQIQDNWFEAECYNAIALLRSSMSKPEEAIAAYKQAIRLAPDQVFAWNNLGNLCAKIGRNDEALVNFIKALECNPQDPIAWNGLGNVYLKIGYLDDAITAYRKSTKFMPSFAHPWNGLGDAYASVGRADDAINAYQKATQLNKRYVTPWLNLGHLFTKQDRFRDALKAFQHAATLDPRNSSIWNEMGLVYSKYNALGEAVEAFSKAIDNDRSYGWAYCNLGMVYVQQGKYKESLPLFIRSVELLKTEKDKSDAWNRLGDVYRQLNEYDKAIQAYEMADQLNQGGQVPVDGKSDQETDLLVSPAPVEISTDPPLEATALKSSVAETQTETLADPVSKTEESKMLDPKGKTAPVWIFPSDFDNAVSGHSQDKAVSPSASSDVNGQAMSALAQKLETAKNNTDKLAEAMTLNEKGNLYFKQGNYEEAILVYNQAIQNDPTLGWPYSNLAHIYFMQNQYAEAILLYQKSIDLVDANRDKAICWNGLGNVYRCLNDYDNAVAAYQKAAELDPDTAGMRDGTGTGEGEQIPKNALAWSDLGSAFLKSGSYKEAIIAFKKAVDMDSSLGSAYNNLALALTYLGKYAEAVPFYRMGIEKITDDKEKAAWLNRLGNAYRKLNDYDNAIKAFQDAIALADEGANLVTRVRFSLLSNCYTD